MPPVGFFFGFDNTPSQLAGDLVGNATYDAPPVVPASPPPTPNNQASLAVEQALRLQQARRKGIEKTFFAGANGGWKAPTSQFNAGQTGAAPLIK
jgi:hypothetical protein